MITIDLPPGVVNVASRKAKTGSCRETHLVRWEGSTMLPVGGWETIDYTAFASRLRVIHKWVDNAGQILVAFLCEQHCYVDVGDGILIDITPIDGIAAPPGVGDGGFGDGLYGDGLYGDPPEGVSRDIVATPCYTLDNWGEELRAMTSADGRYLYWTPQAPTTELSAVPNAPAGRTFVVTPERHAMIFEAGGEPGRIEWSDEEDDTEWTLSTTTKAGGFSVEPRSPIISARVGPGGIFFSTARAAHLTRWVGSPYIYEASDTKISDCPPPISAAAIVSVPEGLMWLAVNGFWMFNGVGCYPVDCSVWEWVRKQFNISFSRYFAAAMPNPSKFEVWFNFVSSDASFNDRLVIFNYKDKTWSMGRLSRICGAAFQSDANPLMSDGEWVYRHETGFDYPGEEMPWAETFVINTGNGSLKTTIRQMLPEIISGSPQAVRFKFYTSNNPTKNVEVLSSGKNVRDNGYVDVRVSGRDIRMRTEMIAQMEWSLGSVQMDVVGRGTQ